MAKKKSKVLSITCAENIALLYFLHTVPALPSSNPITRSPIPQEGYSLSFEQEKSLADTLAFLSSTKDDPNLIPAVCIEEKPESNSMNVLLAVNRVTRQGGNKFLENVRERFEILFDVLSRASDGELNAFIYILC